MVLNDIADIIFSGFYLSSKENHGIHVFLNDINVSIEPLRIIRNFQGLKYFGKGSKVFGMTIFIFKNCELEYSNSLQCIFFF